MCFYHSYIAVVGNSFLKGLLGPVQLGTMAWGRGGGSAFPLHYFPELKQLGEEAELFPHFGAGQLWNTEVLLLINLEASKIV